MKIISKLKSSSTKDEVQDQRNIFPTLRGAPSNDRQGIFNGLLQRHCLPVGIFFGIIF